MEAGRQASREMEAEPASIIRIAGGGEDEGRPGEEVEEEEEVGGVKQRKQREGPLHL